MTTKTISYWDSLVGAVPSEAFHTIKQIVTFKILYDLTDGTS